MSKILNQIKDAEDSLKNVDTQENEARKKIEETVFENLNLFQDKISCLHNRLETLSNSLEEDLIFKKEPS